MRTITTDQNEVYQIVEEMNTLWSTWDWWRATSPTGRYYLKKLEVNEEQKEQPLEQDSWFRYKVDDVIVIKKDLKWEFGDLAWKTLKIESIDCGRYVSTYRNETWYIKEIRIDHDATAELHIQSPDKDENSVDNMKEELPVLSITLDGTDEQNKVREDFIEPIMMHSKYFPRMVKQTVEWVDWEEILVQLKTNGYYIDCKEIHNPTAIQYIEDLTWIKCDDYKYWRDYVYIEHFQDWRAISQITDFKYMEKLTPITIPQWYIEQHTQEDKNDDVDEEIVYEVWDKVVIKNNILRQWQPHVRAWKVWTIIKSKWFDIWKKFDYEVQICESWGKLLFVENQIDHEATALLKNNQPESEAILQSTEQVVSEQPQQEDWIEEATK